MKNFLKKYKFVIFVVVLAIVRLLLTCKCTIQQIATASVDDAWTVFTAYCLKRGQWQGGFSCNTMIKGISASLLLALSSSLKISYTNFVAGLYILSVCLFIYSIRNIVKNKYVLGIIYIILLFNPIMFAYGILQRVYRNSFVPSISLFIFSLYFIILNKENETKTDLAFYNIWIGVFLAIFWNLREDSIWIVPFLIFMIIAILITKCKTVKKFAAYSTIMLIPIVITIGINNLICLINYEYYGVYKRINFDNDCIDLMKAIDYEGKTDTISISMEKMKMLCEMSPSLSEYKEKIMYYMDVYGKLDDHPEDGEVSNGYFPWAMRSALSEVGIYENATKADEYYEKVYQELSTAIEKGELTVSSGISNNLIYSIGAKIKYTAKLTVTFKEINMSMNTESQYGMQLVNKMYEEIAINKMIYTKEDIEEYELADLEEQNEYLEKYGFLENIINGIIKIYQTIAVPAFVVSIIGYLGLFYEFIIRKRIKYRNYWLLASGMIGSAFCVVCGIAYASITNASSVIVPFYLCGAYVPMLIFECFSIYYLCRKIKEKIKCKN